MKEALHSCSWSNFFVVFIPTHNYELRGSKTSNDSLCLSSSKKNKQINLNLICFLSQDQWILTKITEMATVTWGIDLGELRCASGFAERLNLNVARTCNYLIYKFLGVILLPGRLHIYKPSFITKFEKYWFLRGFHRALLAIKVAFGRTELEVLTPQMLWVGTWGNPSPGNEGMKEFIWYFTSTLK